MEGEAESLLALPADNCEITDEIVAKVVERRQLFPEFVIALAERQISRDPSLDKLTVMRGLRDELILRIGRSTLISGEVVE